jgi:hypothetical protein
MSSNGGYLGEYKMLIELKEQLHLLREETKDWIEISIRRSTRESTVEQLISWLDENCTGQYHYDTLHINRHMVDVRFELEEDAVQFSLTWS